MISKDETQSHDDPEDGRFSITRRGQNALRIRDPGHSEADEELLSLLEVAWLFVTGTVPFLAAASALLWYDPSNIIATVLFWFTAIPLAVAVPLAIGGSIYDRMEGDRT